MPHAGTGITVIYRLYEPPRRRWIKGYRYNGSYGENLDVGNPEYLEPPGILVHHHPRLFRVSSGISQLFSSEHDLKRLSSSSMWKVKGRTL